MNAKVESAVRFILRTAADNVTKFGDFDLADHLTDLADEYASPAPVVVVNLPDNDWREAKG
jgi:hypothetical protein